MAEPKDVEFLTYVPHELEDLALLKLADDVREAFNWYVPGSTTDDIIELLRGRGTSRVIVVESDGEPMGFLAYERHHYGAIEVCYQEGVSILPVARTRGLYLELTRRSLEDGPCDYVAARTQNPRIYYSLSQFAARDVVHPALDGRPVPPELVEIARDLAEVPDSNFDASTLIVRDVYGYVREDRSFMTSPSEAVNEFFGRSLGTDDGMFVLVGVGSS